MLGRFLDILDNRTNLDDAVVIITSDHGENLVDHAVVVPIGVDDIMQLQEKGFSYFSW